MIGCGALRNRRFYRPASADALVSMLEGSDGMGSWTSEDAECWWRAYMSENGASPDESEQPTLATSDALPTL